MRYAIPHHEKVRAHGGRTSTTRIAMLAGVYTPGRVSQVRQVEG